MTHRSINVKHVVHLGFWRVLVVGGLIAAGTTTTTHVATPPASEPAVSSVATPQLTPIVLVNPTTTTVAPTTTTTTPPWTVGNSGPFAVAPGAPLPTAAECATKVAKAPETRGANKSSNHTSGAAVPATYKNWGTNSAAFGYAKRVDGKYTGTTDEIIQWAACKWGFDPEPVRAQVMVESSWRQSAYGGFVPDTGNCSDPKLRRAITVGTTTTTAAPLITTTTTSTTAPESSIVEVTPSTSVGQPEQTTTTTKPAATSECPTAYGLMQLRSDFQPGSYPMSARSTAWNLDYSLAMKRACYDGVGWNGAKTTGDAWGCVGVHYSGQWLDGPAKAYIAKVQAAEATKAWARF